MSQPNRLASDAAHQFGGIELDRSKPLSFKFDGIRIDGFAGDTILSALLANGIDSYGLLGDQPLGLTEQFCPLASTKRGDALPIERLPAVDGLELSTAGRRKGMRLGQQHSLRLDPTSPVEQRWSHVRPEPTLSADLVVIGGGVAGLAAAEAASTAGRTVIIVERRPWVGGDARYFGAVGDEESPEALTSRLAVQLAERTNVTILVRAEVFALASHRATLHQVEIAEGVPRGRIVAIDALRMVLATGAVQRLPVFPGNRLPGVLPAIGAYHLAKRYGVAHGRSAIVATQSNHAYRLALRLHDAGVAIRRVVDTRIGPQSRFIDFAKASGLTLASGQFPFAARHTRSGLHASFANVGSTNPGAHFDATTLVVSGAWQPDLTLWMLAGGAARWSSERSALVASGHIDGLALAGSAAGYRSMRACAESGRAAQAALFGLDQPVIEDSELGTDLETPDAPTPHAPPAGTVPAFFSTGASLALRPARADAHALSIGDVAASVELGIISPADAGAIAEERGAPGDDLVASDWRPSPPPETPAPQYLAHRFGDDPQRVHLVVDDTRKFDIGALIYSNTTDRDPERAIGVIIEEGTPGGIALVQKAALEGTKRFVVETAAGPSPARPVS